MTDARVVIVGGGAMGVSLLYHLSEMGWQDLILVEKNDLTHGSTWHAAGLCTHFAHNPTVQELRATSVRLYRDTLPKQTGQSCGFHPCGALRITTNRDRMDEFAQVAGLSQFTGYPLEIVTPDRIAELHPLAQLDGIIGGIYEPDDGHVDPSLATHAMAKIAQRAGATIQRHNAVRAIEQTPTGWQVQTDNGALQTKHIVNAAGTWGWEVGRMMGLNIPSVPVLHQYLVTEAVSAVTERTREGLPELPMIRDPEESWYVRQERDGLILGPYEKEAQVWAVDGCPPDFGADLFPADLDRVEPIIDAALARIPALGSAGIRTVINGPITFTPDANPLIGPAYGLSNAWLLTGSSMGVMEGGGAGWFLAHWMTHGAPPMDALAIDSRRFGTWADRSYRVDKAIECFGLQFGVHYPFEERMAGRNKRLSPLHSLMRERGADMGSVNGWERPNCFPGDANRDTRDSFRRTSEFSTIANEVTTVTQRVALGDLSVFAKFSVSGPDALRFVNNLGANTAPSLGRLGLTHALTPEGGVASEFTVATLNQEHVYLTSASAAEDMDFALLSERASPFAVTVQNCTESLAVIALMGPRSRDVLRKLTTEDLDLGFSWLSVIALTLAGVETRAMRVSYLGELGWELHLPAEHAETVYLALESAGQEFGIGHYGALAANSMRLEKGYRAWGADLTTERSPLEAGLQHLVKMDGRAFVGRDAMCARTRPWEMVLLDIETSDTDPFYAHPVLKDGQPVGIVTSGAFGHRTQKTLALAYLSEPAARDGLQVQILSAKRPAMILERPPFDPLNTRLRS